MSGRGGFFHRNGHAFTVRDLKHGDKGVGLVRDPVARFRSAWDFQWAGKTPREAVLGRWPSIDHLALALHDPETLPRLHGILGWLFEPLVRWYVDAETALASCVWIGHTESLDRDWPRLLELVGLDPAAYPLPPPGNKRRNERVQYTPMSPDAEAAVRAFYAEDYRLLEAL